MSITGDNYNYRSTNFVDQDEPNGLVPGEQRRDSDDITENNHSRDTCQIKTNLKNILHERGSRLAMEQG